MMPLRLDGGGFARMEKETLHSEAMSLAEALEDEAAYFPANSRLMYKSAMMLRLLALKVSEDDIAADE
jgi:hypothetical protein